MRSASMIAVAAATHIIPMVIDIVLFAIIASMLIILDICWYRTLEGLGEEQKKLPKETSDDGWWLMMVEQDLRVTNLGDDGPTSDIW